MCYSDAARPPLPPIRGAAEDHGDIRLSAADGTSFAAYEARAGKPTGRGIVVMRAKNDVTSANIFESILADEEHHIDYIETNLELIDRLGEQLYLAQLVDQPPVPG